jgi:hypothetical protein
MAFRNGQPADGTFPGHYRMCCACEIIVGLPEGIKVNVAQALRVMGLDEAGRPTRNAQRQQVHRSNWNAQAVWSEATIGDGWTFN